MADEESTKESNGVLASALFGQAFGNMYQYHLEQAQRDKAQGLSDKAEDHERKAQLALANSILLSPAPLLSEEENVQYLRLLNEGYSVNPDGTFNEKKVGESNKQRLTELTKKGFPEYQKEAGR